jgi:hypothetical protein
MSKMARRRLPRCAGVCAVCYIDSVL